MGNGCQNVKTPVKTKEKKISLAFGINIDI
jgi:hypothetical protein